MNSEELDKIVEEEKRSRQSLKHEICVCVAADCLCAHSEDVKAVLEKEVKQHGLGHQCKVKGVGCLGLCASGPLIAVEGGEKRTLYCNVTAQDAPEIVGTLGKEPVKRLPVRTQTTRSCP